jgi:Transposase DDE domain
MTASLDTLVVAAYVFADSFVIPRSGPVGKISDAELIALSVAQAVIGVPSDRQFLGLVERLLPGWFPHLPDQSQYNRRLRRLTPWITTTQLGVAELVSTGQVRLVDGTLLSCANYAGCAQQSLFGGHAGYGYCASKSQWYWGMRLVLMSDRNGVPVGYDLTPAGEREYEATYRLAQAHPGTTLFADKGLWGARFQRTLELIDIQLVTPDHHRLGQRPPSEVEKARIRLVIESVFSNLKRQMRLEHHLAKTLPGLAQRIAQRLLALTLGMLLNQILGRPLRNLVAYDGR